MKRISFSFALAVGIAATVPVMAEPLIYVAAGSANKILVIDTKDNRVIKEFSDIANPHALTATPDGEYVIAGSLATQVGPDGKKGTVYLIHPEHGHVMTEFDVPGAIHHQAISPDGRFVVSTHPTLGGVSYTDLQGEGGVMFLKTGRVPNYTVFTNDGKTAYVTNSTDGTISVINVANWTVRRTLKAGKTPEHMSLSKDGTTLYVVNALPGTVSAVSVATGGVVDNFLIGKGAHGLDLSEDGSALFATSKKSGIVVKVDLRTSRRQELALAPSPYHLEALHGTGNIYVSSSKSPKIWVIDANTFEVKDEIAISGKGHQMTLVAHNDH